MNDPLLARLAAANPIPAGEASPTLRSRIGTEPVRHAHRRFRRPVLAYRLRRPVLVSALAVAVAIPAAAFADDIGGLLGLSNQGTTVASSSLPEAQISGFAQAMQELHWPGQSQLLGVRDGLAFHAAINADGAFCLAIGAVDEQPPQMVGCAPSGMFPSTGRPILGLPMTRGTDDPGTTKIVPYLIGIAVDGIARVDLVAADGSTIVSAPVTDNIYDASDVPAVPAAAVVAYDGNGNAVYRTTFTTGP